MTRFREEYYESRSYKAFISRGKKGAPSHSAIDTRESRKKYFEKSLAQRKAIYKAQAKRLDGF